MGSWPIHYPSCTGVLWLCSVCTLQCNESPLIVAHVKSTSTYTFVFSTVTAGVRDPWSLILWLYYSRKVPRATVSKMVAETITSSCQKEPDYMSFHSHSIAQDCPEVMPPWKGVWKISLFLDPIITEGSSDHTSREQIRRQTRTLPFILWHHCHFSFCSPSYSYHYSFIPRNPIFFPFAWAPIPFFKNISGLYPSTLVCGCYEDGCLLHLCHSILYGCFVLFVSYTLHFFPAELLSPSWIHCLFSQVSSDCSLCQNYLPATNHLFLMVLSVPTPKMAHLSLNTYP